MILTGNKEYYKGIDAIRYEGKESDNPLAFKSMTLNAQLQVKK